MGNRIKRRLKRALPNIVKSCIFLVLVAVMLTAIYKVLWMRDDTYSAQGFDEFYDLPEEKVDVVVLGSSGMKEYFNVVQAFHDFGVSGGNLATSSQQIRATKYLMEEALKTQSPKLFVIDTRSLHYNDNGLDDISIRRITDSMNWSWNRIKLIQTLFKDLIQIRPDDEYNIWHYYLSFAVYHSRWKDLTSVDFTGYEDMWEGFLINTATEEQEGQPSNVMDVQPEALTELQTEALKDLLEYCKTIDSQVLFINVPYYMQEEHAGRSLTAGAMIQSEGFTYIDLNNVVEGMNLDPKTDFRNWQHVNAYGSIKFTDFLANYIQTTYGLADHRGDADYAIYEEKYDHYAQRLLQVTTNFDQYLNILPRYADAEITISYTEDAWNTILTPEQRSAIQDMIKMNLIDTSDDASGGNTYFRQNAICIMLRDHETGEILDTAQYHYSANQQSKELLHDGKAVDYILPF